MSTPEATARWIIAAIAVTTAMGGAPSAGAAVGAPTEYPIPVDTTTYGITAGPDGRMWFVDSGNHVGGPAVGRMSTDGTIAAADVVTLPTGELGTAITTGPDGNIWLLQGSHMDKIPPTVSKTSEIVQYAAGGGYSVFTGPDGRVWFTNQTAIHAMTTSGVDTPYPTGASAEIAAAAVGADHKIWFGRPNSDGSTDIVRMSTSGAIGAGDVFHLPTNDGDVRRMVLAPDGNLWFTLQLASGGGIGRITPQGAIKIFATPTANSLPFGIAYGADGRIWWAERNGDRFGSIAANATSSSDAVEYPVLGSNLGLIGLAAGPDGRIWGPEFNSNKIAALSTTADPPRSFGLTITRAGAGGGTVASAPAGIDCGGTCAATFASGATVTLTATPAAGSTFEGWSQDCAGAGGCTVTMSQARAVTATFAATPLAPPPATLTAAPARTVSTPSQVALDPAKVIGFPTTKRCASRRTFGIRLHIPAGVTVTDAVVKVGSKQVAVVRGRRLRSAIDLRRFAKGRFTVTITVHTADGQTLRGKRRYKTCAKKHRHTHKHGV